VGIDEFGGVNMWFDGFLIKYIYIYNHRMGYYYNPNCYSTSCRYSCCMSNGQCPSVSSGCYYYYTSYYSSSDSTASAGTISGAVVGAVIGLIIIIAIACYCYRKRQR
jgi:hypothetical protein